MAVSNGGCRPAYFKKESFWFGVVAGAIVALLAAKLFGLF
jgi:hypothetical protein